MAWYVFLTSTKIPVQFFSCLSWVAHHLYQLVQLTSSIGDGAGRISNDVKVPTIISYNGKTDFKWGYQVKLSDKSIVGIKLLLDPDQDKPSYLPGSGKRTALKSLPKPAVDVAADYIGAVYKHAIQEIRKNSVGGFFDTCEREVVLTVPAVWSDKAKDLTLQVRYV